SEQSIASTAMALERFSTGRSISGCSTINGVHEIGAAILSGLGLESPVIADRVAQFEGVDRFREADAVTHVEPRREVLTEHQGRVVVAAALDAHVLEP